MDREKFAALNDPAVRARNASLPRTDAATEAALARNRVKEYLASQKQDVDPEIDEKAAAERLRQSLLRLGERELAWKTKLKQAAGHSGLAKALFDRLVAEYEKRIRVCLAEGQGVSELRALVEELEAAQQDRVNELTRIATAEAEEIARTREIAEREEALKFAEGMSPAQAMRWLEQRGFRIRLRKGAIELSPAGNVTRKEMAMVKIHYRGLTALLTAAEQWLAVEAVE